MEPHSRCGSPAPAASPHTRNPSWPPESDRGCWLGRIRVPLEFPPGAATWIPGHEVDALPSPSFRATGRFAKATHRPMLPASDRAVGSWLTDSGSNVRRPVLRASPQVEQPGSTTVEGRAFLYAG